MWISQIASLQCLFHSWAWLMDIMPYFKMHRVLVYCEGLCRAVSLGVSSIVPTGSNALEWTIPIVIPEVYFRVDRLVLSKQDARWTVSNAKRMTGGTLTKGSAETPPFTKPLCVALERHLKIRKCWNTDFCGMLPCFSAPFQVALQYSS